MMRHPEVVEQVRSESEKVLKDHSDSVPEITAVDTAIFNAMSLPYAMAVFYETLRLYPPIPFEIRQCQETTTLPDGTLLPESSVVVWCIWAMNRSRIIWGEDADDFKPERWLEEGQLKTKTAFEFPVFNGGTRMCLGKKMAEVVAVQTIATFVLSFDFEPLDARERISANSLTLPMEGGLPVHLSPTFRAKGQA
jgi:cytochrome P450